MLVHGTFFFICKRNHSIDKFQISRLGNVFIYCREQPQRIICTISRVSCLLHIRSIIRCILMSRIVRKFYKWKSATIINLCWEHEFYLFNSHLRCKMYDTLNILNSITITVTISQSAVCKWCSPWPDKRHETVVCIPCIYHCVKFITWSLDLEMW